MHGAQTYSQPKPPIEDTQGTYFSPSTSHILSLGFIHSYNILNLNHPRYCKLEEISLASLALSHKTFEMAISEVIFKISSLAAVVAFVFMLAIIRDLSNCPKQPKSGAATGADKTESQLVVAADVDEQNPPDEDSGINNLSTAAVGGREGPRKQTEAELREAVRGLGGIVIFLILVAFIAALCSDRVSLGLDLTKKTALGETRIFSYLLGTVVSKLVFFVEVPFLVAWEFVKLVWGALIFLPNLAYEFCLSLLIAMGLSLPLWVMVFVSIVVVVAVSFTA